MLLVSSSYRKFSSTPKIIVNIRLFSVGGQKIKVLVAGVSTKKWQCRQINRLREVLVVP